MKKLLVVIIILIAVVAAPPLVSRIVRRSSPRSDGVQSPRSRELEPAEPISAEMSQWLDSRPDSISITAPQDIRELTALWVDIAPRAVNNPQFLLSFTIDPEVQATVTGQWTRAPMRKVLDEVCQRNNLEWKVVGPSTIRISVEQ